MPITTSQGLLEEHGILKPLNILFAFIYRVYVSAHSVSLALLHGGRSQLPSSNMWVLRLNSDFRLLAKHPHLVSHLARLSSVVIGNLSGKGSGSRAKEGPCGGASWGTECDWRSLQMVTSADSDKHTATPRADEDKTLTSYQRDAKPRS